MVRASILVAVLFAVPALAQAPFVEDCGLEPPGSVVSQPVPPKAELPADPNEPPRVRRELRGLRPDGLKGIPTARLRKGALSGKTVYLSAGHGFTYTVTTTLSAWRTQRGNTHDIVEDLVSIETANQYLIPMLLNAGASVVTVREADINPKMAVVDDLSAGYAESGASGLFSDSTLPGFGVPPSPMSGSVEPFKLAKNRLLDSAPTATASATWAPSVPADGYYNVYVSYTAYAGRVTDAHYVVKHAAGEAHFRVNQRRHGGTWVLLGRFYFKAGQHAATASVVLQNDSSSGGNISLDAVRFGGGMGSIRRGSAGVAETVSGRPRFEESCRTYAQFAGAPPAVYGTGTDRTDDISCRSKFAAWDHEPGEDAIYVAWHTNAFNGSARGTDVYVYSNNDVIGVYNYVPCLPNTTTCSQSNCLYKCGAPGSDLLAQAIHSEMINDIRQGWGPTTWQDRGIHSAWFGELNPAYNPEMPSVLLEVAFHDNLTDAAQLKEPWFRYLATRSITQGIIKYFATKDGVAAALPPEPPTGLSALNKGAGVIEVKWRAPAVDTQNVRGQAATGYVLYSSPDGLAWDDGLEVSGTTRSLTVPVGTVRYFRVAALNGGGESFPSDAVGVGSADAAAPVLVVNAFDRLEAALGRKENLASFSLGSPLRIFIERMNDGAYARQHGDAIAYASVPFDGASADAVTSGAVALGSYAVVDWIAGRGHAGAKPPTAAELQVLSAYLGSGKGLLFSGSHTASGLAAGTASEQGFLANVLQASSSGAGGTLVVDGDADQFLSGLTGLVLDDGLAGSYPTGTADSLGALGFPLARYAGTSQAAAVGHAGAGKVVFLGFPFETLTSRPRRLETMGRILKFFGTISTEPPPLDGGVDEPDAGVPVEEPAPIVLDPLPVTYAAVSGGCGCTAAGGAFPWALLWVALALRARRWH